MPRFVGQHALFGATASFPLLPADLLDRVAPGRDEASLTLLDLIQQKTACDETVQPLVTCGLAFDLQASGAMDKEHARGRFVDVLTPMSARANKTLIQLGFGNLQGGHALGHLGFFFQADGKRTHCVRA
jgi:hypothetical protein